MLYIYIYLLLFFFFSFQFNEDIGFPLVVNIKMNHQIFSKTDIKPYWMVDFLLRYFLHSYHQNFSGVGSLYIFFFLQLNDCFNTDLWFLLVFVIILGQVITGSWDKTLKCWDPRGASGQERTLVGTYAQPERVYSLSVVGNRLVVATAGRHVNVYDLRNMSQPEQRRESSLKYQTRCVRCYPNGTGIVFEKIFFCFNILLTLH